jgi:hypothetical protein
MTMQARDEGLLLHQKQRDNRNRGESKAKEIGYQGFKSSRFIFFFIWQAIVRGQLFLQKTFFLLSKATNRRNNKATIKNNFQIVLDASSHPFRISN